MLLLICCELSVQSVLCQVPKGKDVSDWLVGGTLESSQALARSNRHLRTRLWRTGARNGNSETATESATGDKDLKRNQVRSLRRSGSLTME